MFTAVGLSWGNLTSHERQSAALIQTPDIHSEIML